MKPSIVSIGYGRHLFDPENIERKRLLACADETAGLHMIVFSLRSHADLSNVRDGALYLYPTCSTHRAFMLIDAIRVALRIVRTEKSDIWRITSQDPLASGFVAYVLKLITKLPLIIQEHGDIFSGSHWKRESLKNQLLYPLARFLIRRADLVRVVSARVKEHVLALGVPEAQIRTLPVFSDLKTMRDSPIRYDLRIAHSKASVIVLSVARFVAQKNLTVLLQAFKKLHTEDSAATLVLVGSGPEEHSLKKEAQELGIAGAITWMPWSSDVSSLMKSADIYALSSNYEGWARVLPEAMACGVPAVSTDVGCAGEIFLDGRHGLVVPVGDTAGFAAALIKLAGNPAMRQGFVQAGIEDSAKLASIVADDYALYARRWVAVFQDI